MAKNSSVEIVLSPPEPHSKKQALIMQAFRMGGLKEIYIACGTKFGKSIAASVAMATAAAERPGTRWRWVAPIYEQAKIGMDYFKPILPPKPHTEVQKSGMRVTLPHIDTEIKFWHTKDPVSLEGAGIHGVIHDEAAKQPYEAIISSRTTTTFTKGPMMFISTPYGKNWFYSGCMEAKEVMEWEMKKGKAPTKIFLTARTLDNPFIDAEVVEAAKRDMPDRMFRQYWLAEFLDDGSVFTNVRQCLYGDELDVGGGRQFAVAQNSKTMNVVIGVDWAKKEDYTVFGAFTYDGEKPTMVGFQRFQGMGYLEAIKELYMFCKNFKSVGVIYHDKTGVGESLDEMLGSFPYAYEGIVFTTQSKSYMVNQLAMAFEKEELRLMNWPTMLKELDSYEMSLTQLGTPRYSAPTGMHDDIVSMMILANAALVDFRGSGLGVNFLEDLPGKKLSLERWYQDMIEDDEELDSPFPLIGGL